jgi:hypothetical protein
MVESRRGGVEQGTQHWTRSQMAVIIANRFGNCFSGTSVSLAILTAETHEELETIRLEKYFETLLRT